jgi:putative glutathione S-transferase
VVEPWLLEEGWHFGDYPGTDRDTINNVEWLHQLYTKADPTFTGRATVPVLWDKKTHTIVNNESADIVRMLNSGFGELARGSIDLYPAALREEIDQLNAAIYPTLNNGVYRAGLPPPRSVMKRQSAMCSPCSIRWKRALQRGIFSAADS